MISVRNFVEKLKSNSIKTKTNFPSIYILNEIYPC